MSSKPPTFDDNSEWVQLGTHAYQVVDQPLPRLRRKLGSVWAGIETAEVSAENVLDLFSEKAYDFFRIFIRDLMPRWEWEGYASQAAMDADEPDDASELHAPTPSQIKTAAVVCMKVSGLDGMKNALGGLVDPKWLRSRISLMLEDFLSRESSSGSSALALTPSMTASPPAPPTEESTTDALPGSGSESNRAVASAPSV